MSFPFGTESIVFVTLAGSHAHATARESSDVDLRGVCIVPLAHRLSLGRCFEQYDGPFEGALAETLRTSLVEHPLLAGRTIGNVESVLFDVAKFVRLCAEANPNALEVLFADERDWIMATAAWRSLHHARFLFLTKKVEHTFSGYALSQLKRIRTHRSWLLEPPMCKPLREDFGLPDSGTLGHDDRHRIEQSIAERTRSYGVDDLDMPKATRLAVRERIESLLLEALAVTPEELEERLRAVASHGLNLPIDVVTTLNAERKYRGAMRHWQSYQTWLTHRNPARAELERRHGYDTKHAMHLVRLMRMGLEALENGDLEVRRHDAQELLSIRDGALSFDELLATAEDLRERISAAAARTTLPSEVDLDEIDQLLFSLVT